MKNDVKKTNHSKSRSIGARRKKPQLLTDVAFETLKSDIIRCRLPPGLEITEAELCERLDLGKAPIRGALARLHQKGFVQPIPRHGYLITPITLKGIQDSYELRLLFEPAVARLAAGRVDVSVLRNLNVKPCAAKGEKMRLDFLESNRDFHVAIAVATGNERIASIMINLFDDMARLIHLGLFSEDRPDNATRFEHEAQVKQHDEIITALEAGDADAAEAMVRTHVEDNRRMVMEAITIHGSLGMGPLPLWNRR